MADLKVSKDSEQSSLSDRSKSNKIAPDLRAAVLSSTAIRFEDLRVNDPEQIHSYIEIIDLLAEHGFDRIVIEREGGRLSLDVERWHDPSASESPGFPTELPGVSSNPIAEQTPEVLVDTSEPNRFLVRDIGLFSYTAGLIAAAASMALAIGPAWLGFVAGFLPATLIASWAVSAHA